MAKIQKYICTNCKHVGKAKAVRRGSKRLSTLLWVIFPINILYLLYRFSGSKKTCEECGSLDIYQTKSDLLEVMSFQNSINENNK